MDWFAVLCVVFMLVAVYFAVVAQFDYSKIAVGLSVTTALLCVADKIDTRSR